MATIEFELNNGTKKTVEFEGNPTEADIEEVAQSLNLNNEQPQQISNQNDYSQNENYTPDENNVLKAGIEKSIDLTPSGIVKQATAGIASPVRALTRGETIPEAYKRAREIQEESALNNLSPLVDFGAYMALPQTKLPQLGTVANMALTGGLQGGLISGLESLKDKGANLPENLKDIGINGAIGAVTGGVLQKANNNIADFLNKDSVKDAISGVVETMTSVPKKYGLNALEKELAGEKLLSKPFDKDVDYRPIERKFKNVLDTFSDIKSATSSAINEHGQKAVRGLNAQLSKAEENITNVLKKMTGESSKDISRLRQQINGYIKASGNGGDINLVEEKGGRALKDLKKHLKMFSKDEMAEMLQSIATKANEEAGILQPLDREREKVAFELLEQLTGKGQDYLRMTLKAINPKESKTKALDSLYDLIANSDLDKIDNIDGSRYFNQFPELQQIMQDSNSNKEFASKLADRIVGRKFTQSFDDPIQQMTQEANSKYANIINNLKDNVLNMGFIPKGMKRNNPFDMAMANLQNELKAFGSEDLTNFYTMKLVEDMQKMDDIINPQVTAIDLHRAKESLYDMANYGDNASGIGNNVAKQLASKINDFLKTRNPNYAHANERYALLKDIQASINASRLNDRHILNDGDSMAKLLSKYGSDDYNISGYNRRIKDFNNILDRKEMFLKDLQSTLKTQQHYDDLDSLIGRKQYMQNPKLLEGFYDEARTNALSEMEHLTNSKFMDELKDIRTQDAFDQLFAGQGGGSGSSQGMANLTRKTLASEAGKIPFLGSVLATTLFSPKLMGKGTIGGIAELYRNANKEIPKWLLPIILTSTAKLNEE